MMNLFVRNFLRGAGRFEIELNWWLVLGVLALERSLTTLPHTLASVPETHANSSAVNITISMTRAQEVVDQNISVTEPWITDSLLPKDVTPEVYDLYLFPHLNKGIFKGVVSVSINVAKPRNHLILHSQSLSIENTNVLTSSNKSLEIVRVHEYKKNQFWVIELRDIISPGSYRISLQFSGKLTSKNVGFYRSSYIDLNGQTRYIATTKFEPTYARQAFPCFDEPILKAKFNVKLVRPSDKYIALSNMNVLAEEPDSPSKGVTTVVFETTPPMSTYFTCFIICDFEHLKPVALENNTSVTVYARSGQINHMKFAKDLAIKAMEFYTDYFGISYPLPKLDLIAIPDFVSGAMENWGLVTFRETFALITEGESNTLNYEQVADTVAHELAHMWFGDLVTMAWWDDLWLNEGFATFLTIICVQKLLPEWNVEEDSLLKTRLAVMIDDAALSSHPIIQSVSHPDQITEMFDAISYRKGSAVLVMLESLGPEKFRRGVSNYLKKFKFGNAKTEDLWRSIEEEMDDFNVSRVMGTWTKQMGYPLVTVTQEGNELVFRQERFLADKTASFTVESSPYRYKWDIPITYMCSEDPNKVERFFLNIENEFVKKPISSTTKWYKVNHKQKGFYRVNYSENGWKNLESLLLSDIKALTAGDRANIIDDSFSLAQAGYLQYDIPLSLISYIKDKYETSSPPLKVISRHIDNLKSKLIKTSFYSYFKMYIQTILEPVITDGLWTINEDDTFEEKKIKLTLLLMACRFEIPAALQRARSLFRDWINGKSDKPNAQLRNLVYNYGIDGEDVVDNWEKLWNIYLNETNPEEKVKFRRSLGLVSNEDILKRYLELAKNEEFVRSQDYFSVLGSVADNPVGLQIVWDFIRNEWTYLVDRFTLNDRYLGRIVPAVVSSFSTEAQLEEVKSFFIRNPDAGAGANGRKNALEAIDNNIKWNNKHLPVIETWLSNITKKYFHLRPH